LSKSDLSALDALMLSTIGAVSFLSPLHLLPGIPVSKFLACIYYDRIGMPNVEWTTN